MKFGAQLRSKSVPEWRSHDIDYNEIKLKIRITTENDCRSELVKDLYETIIEQVDHVNLFLNSKIGEVKRRIIHTEKLIEKFDTVQDYGDHRYIEIENSLTLLTSDLQKLSRFTVIQKTGLRKLLKKYTKYSNDGGQLNLKVNKYMIKNPDSFIHLDLTGLFLELVLVYDLIREKKTAHVKNLSTASKRRSSLSNPMDSLNINESFDFESTKNGTYKRNFLVHYDNLAELKLLLLSNFNLIDEAVTNQRKRLQLTKKHSTLSLHEIIRQNSSTDLTKKSNTEAGDDSTNRNTYDSNSIYVDDSDRLSNNHTTSQIFFEDPKAFNSIKNNVDPGVLINELNSPDRSLLISTIGGLRKSANVSLRNDNFVTSLLNSLLNSIPFDQFCLKNIEVWNSLDSLEKISIEWLFSKHLKPLVKVNKTRSRYSNTAISKGSNLKCWITLDSNMLLSCEDLHTPLWTDTNQSSDIVFPYALLQIRYNSQNQLTSATEDLCNSHLVYEIEESFSILTYLLFKTSKLSFNPLWANLFGDKVVDIRKLPPKIRKTKSKARFKPQALTSVSESHSDSPNTQNTSISGESSQIRYWNEFDNGSEGEQDDVFMITVKDGGVSLFSSSAIDNIFSLSSKISKSLSNHLPSIFDTFDKSPLKSTQHQNYGSASEFSDTESLLNDSEIKVAHDKFMIFLALSSSLLALFLTAVSLGITSSLYSYGNVALSTLVVTILLVSMLVSLFFAILAMCLLMTSESENRTILQSGIVWTVFIFVTLVIIGQMIGIFGL